MREPAKIPAHMRGPESVRRYYGNDAFGPFLIEVDDCPICGFEDGYVIRWYKGVTLPDYVRNARSLIIRKDRTHLHRKVGINCGCYSKFHRQVAHINGGSKK